MVLNTHYIELFIDGQLVEIESQNSLNLRLNNVLFSPTLTSTNQAEYSFSFNIPSTPNNDKILNYANNLAKVNKFRTRYNAQVYADGDIIFDGSLTVQKYDARDMAYSCNLVNIKVNTLDELFGDEVLSNARWMVDFNGASTINEKNQDEDSKFFFPLVSYGAFQKESISSIETSEGDVIREYTSKYLIDNTNKFYLSTFYPSLNVLEQVRKCFEYKGLNVGGEAFSDPILTKIYASTNLGEDQLPTYNVGNPKFGKIRLTARWVDNAQSTVYSQDLRFPYFPIEDERTFKPNVRDVDATNEVHYNFSDIFYTPLLKGDVEIDEPSAMMSPKEGVIEIPSDGFYKVSLSGEIRLLDSANTLTSTQYIQQFKGIGYRNRYEVTSGNVTFNKDMRVTTPIEIQLIRNYDENIELIKGKNNVYLKDGNPSHMTYCDQGYEFNYYNYETCYPHEKCGANMDFFFPTNKNEIADTLFNRSDANIGYINQNNTIMAYDTVVSDAFICGWSTMGCKESGGTVAFVKNGYSWSKTKTSRTDAMYKQDGYRRLWIDQYGTTHSSVSKHNENALKNVPNSYFIQYGDYCEASINGMVWLNKGDLVELMLVKRGYWNGDARVDYHTSGTTTLTIEAASPRDIFMLRASEYGWNSPIEFDTQLNLMEFTSNKTKISDYLKNIADAFNLTYTMNGNNVDVSVNKGIKKNINYAVNIDDRVSSNDCESEYISYPREMSVQYKIDTDEHGFYESVSEEDINKPNWKSYGDSGYTVIKLNDDSYETSTQNKQTQFSYNWYDEFTFQPTETDEPTSITLSVISKEEYMIEGFNDEEAMKHRGYNLSQRFWFRQPSSLGCSVKLEDDYLIVESQGHKYPIEATVLLFSTSNEHNGVNLSYKDTEVSLLTEYFNVHPLIASNYVNVECYLTPKEYEDIKGGALVHFDSDLYYVSEIQGYDPSGANKTQLKLIKKV